MAGEGAKRGVLEIEYVWRCGGSGDSVPTGLCRRSASTLPLDTLRIPGCPGCQGCCSSRLEMQHLQQVMLRSASSQGSRVAPQWRRSGVSPRLRPLEPSGDASRAWLARPAWPRGQGRTTAAPPRPFSPFSTPLRRTRVCPGAAVSRLAGAPRSQISGL